MWETVACLFTVAVALLLPVAALVILAIKKDRLVKPYLLGALTFLVFQVLTRIPLLNLVLANMSWYIVLPMISPVLYALFLGFTAALFEEGGRFLVMRFLMRDHARWLDGFAFGVGHGGIEAVLLAGIAALSTLAMPGGPAASGAMGLDFIASGVERLSAMTMHVAWSLMVLQSVRRRVRWLLLAVALHTAVDTGMLLVKPYISMMALEAVLAAAAIVMTVYIIYTKKSWEVSRK